MKNKKLIILTVCLLILSLSMIVFAGCDKSDTPDLSTLLNKDNTNQTYNVETKALPALDNYTILQASNNFVFAYTAQPESTEYTFILYNLKHENILGTFTSGNINNVQFENRQPFLATVSVKDGTGFTTVSHYSEYSILCSGDQNEYGIKSVSSQGSVAAVVFNNGNYAYETANGSVAVIAPSISNPPVYQMQEYDDFYLYEKSGVYYVYDKNSLKLIGNYNFDNVVESEAAGYDEISRFMSDKTVIINLRKELEEDETSYDIYDSSRQIKYDYKTLYVDLKNGKCSVDEDPDIIIEDTAECNSEEYFNCSFFSYKEIKNKSFSVFAKLGAFDKNGKLVMCINDIVPTAVAIEHAGDVIAVLSSNTSDTAVYNFFDLNGKKLFSMPQSELNSYYGGTFINYKGIIFDINGNKCLVPEADWTIKDFDNKTDKIIYYQLVKEVNDGETTTYINETYAYDAKTDKISLIDNKGNIVFERGFYSVYDSDNKTLSAYSAYDGTPIFKDKDYVDVSYYNCGDYTVIFGAREDGTTNAYICNNM